MKVLTIVVPAFNVEHFIARAIERYSDARFSDKLEILFIDDGSTDGTKAMCEEAAARFPDMMRVISKTNGGHGSCINTGIREARGTYFFIVDGDDWVCTENLVKLLEILQTATADIVCTKKREVEMHSSESRLFPLPANVKKSELQTLDTILNQKEIVAYLSLHTCIFKTEIVQKNEISVLEHCFYVDYEYIVKAVCASNTIIFEDLEIYHYLVGNVNQSVSDEKMVERYEQHERVIDSLLDFYEKNENYRFFAKQKIALLIKAHYKILLLLFTDKKKGKKLSADFSQKVKNRAKEFWKIGETRRKLLGIVSFFHFNGSTLQNIRLKHPFLHTLLHRIF